MLLICDTTHKNEKNRQDGTPTAVQRAVIQRDKELMVKIDELQHALDVLGAEQLACIHGGMFPPKSLLMKIEAVRYVLAEAVNARANEVKVLFEFLYTFLISLF
jgi:hypothetical protein